MAASVIPNSDITIYNRYILNRAEKYQRYEVSDVVWQSTQSVTTKFTAANLATVFIPFSQCDNYLPFKEWTYGTDNWTLHEGDIMVRGIVTDEITDTFTLSDLRAAYNNVFTVTTIDEMNQGSLHMRHYMVGLK